MKKFLATLMVCIMCLTTGCGTTTTKPQEQSKSPVKQTVTVEQTENKQQSAEQPTTAEESKLKQPIINNTGEVKVHFIDVGQADSILIQQGEHSMLIDAGNNEDGETVCNYIKAQGVNTLEYVVGTHPHEDHIGGLDNVINTFGVNNVYMPKKSTTTKTYRDVLIAIKNKNLTIKAPTVGESFKLGQAEFDVLAPHKIYEDVNNCSIVLKMKYGNNSFLFTGDAEAVSEMDMVNANADLKCDVLKVGHHGSKTSTCSNFLSKVSPKYTVVSVGKENKYKHPNQSTMDRLGSMSVYRTDENGTVVMTSNGSNIKFSCVPGSHIGHKESSTASNKPTTEQNKKTVITTTTTNNTEQMVWISATGKKYHNKPNCGRMNPKKATKISLSKAKKNYEPCKKCFN